MLENFSKRNSKERKQPDINKFWKFISSRNICSRMLSFSPKWSWDIKFMENWLLCARLTALRYLLVLLSHFFSPPTITIFIMKLWTIRCHREDNNWFISNVIRTFWAQPRYMEHKNITLALNGRLLRQFDQIDGLCAKINELFNGAFPEQSRHFQLKSKSKSGFEFEDQSLDICYSTYFLPTH